MKKFCFFVLMTIGIMLFYSNVFADNIQLISKGKLQNNEEYIYIPNGIPEKIKVGYPEDVYGDFSEMGIVTVEDKINTIFDKDIKVNDVVGKANIYFNGKYVGETNIVALQASKVHWSSKYIKILNDKGLISYDEYEPEKYISKGKFFSLLDKLIGIKKQYKNLDCKISKAEACGALYAYMNVMPTNTHIKYANSAVPEWAKEYVGTAINYGLINEFKKDAPLKYCEAVTMLARVSNYKTTATNPEYINYSRKMSKAEQFIIKWAMSFVGKDKFTSYRNGTCISTNWCARFVSSAYAFSGKGYPGGNAIDMPHNNKFNYINGKIDCNNIPIGATIVSKGTGVYGHVALYVGNGHVIEAGGQKILYKPIMESLGNKFGFLGWGVPARL